MGALVFLAVLILMAVSWFVGRSLGYEDGYDAGYVQGDFDASEKWRPKGSVRPIHPER